MLRKYLASAILAFSLLYPQNLCSAERAKRTAYVYWDAYADEKYQKPTDDCPKWKPCLESLVNSAEKKIVSEVKQSKRFRRHYDGLDFVLKKVGKWESPADDGDDWVMFPIYVLEKFKYKRPIRANEIDIRLGFTLRPIIADGYAEDIPGRFLIVSAKTKRLDTLIHESGHLLSLYHNAENGDHMHPNFDFPNAKFSREARAIMADSIMSIISARGLHFRLEHNKIWLEAARLAYQMRLDIKCNTGTNNRCILHENKMYLAQATIAVNPSGSFSIRYSYAKMNETHEDIKSVAKMERLFHFLKSLGISEAAEEAVFYKARSDLPSQWLNFAINIEEKHFIRHYDKIVGYLRFSGLMPDGTAKALGVAKEISFAYGLKMFDVLYHYARKE